MIGIPIRITIAILLLSFLFLSTHSVLAQEQQWVTYENPYFGITIQHPSGWEVASSNTDASPPPPGFAKQIVKLSASDPNTNAGLIIQTQIVESNLDTDTMKVKNATLEDYVRSEKMGITKEEIADFTGSSNTRMELLRDNQTTVAGNPAWRIESML